MPTRPTAVEEPGAGHPFPPDLHDARHLWLKAGLLLVWAAVSFGACYFARDLQVMVGDWPLGYWIASQGAVLVFIGIVAAYCAAMNHFERQDANAAADAGAGSPAPDAPRASAPGSPHG
ncbi:DUF4212 domain-containing protein [Acidovorax sp. NCPPB 3576]|uniref:DUF4212 domain-containing protein n=1 Tax=Acidovorax sp. NCPPB 3576 TaxID=2940488 RepID=UPI00234BE6E1|nr:DUF4212 domain-containing protein [Acidovorax sp. NCPPB 3576]WCM89757.1 DUF4212 domain-containing protein [Acidovorax sp. NCPPB 3576]